MRDKYGEYLGAAIKAAEEAGGIARSMQHALRDVRYKGEKDVVTEADLAPPPVEGDAAEEGAPA